MAKDKYNWWDDPQNKDEIERVSWWNHAENKEFFQFPISVAQSGDVWVATCNDETKKILGDRLHGCAQGDTKEEAISKMFELIKFTHEFSEYRVLKYQRWVPFRKGNWGHKGGRWFVVFGIHFYIRNGKGMKGGWYIPLTKLNISVHSEWSIYRNRTFFKKELANPQIRD